MYIIEYSEQANQDMDNLFEAIAQKYCAPITAFKYLRELQNTIKILEQYPESYAIRNPYLAIKRPQQNDTDNLKNPY